MRKFIVLFLFFTAAFGCNNYRSQEIKVDAKQNVFDSVTVSVFRESAGKRTYLANKEVRIIMLDREISAKTDDSGFLTVNVPDDMTTKIDKITIFIDGNSHDIPFIKKKVSLKRSVECQPISYKKIIIQVMQIRLEENKPGSEFAEVGSHPFEGKVLIQISGYVEKVKYTGDGKIELILEEDEMKRFVSQPDLVIKFEDGDVWTGRVDLPPLTGKVEIRKETQTDDCFIGVLVNGTFETANVILRAGYVRYGDEWFIGKILSRKYFAEIEYELAPGEMKKVELSYPKPPIGDRQLRYKLEVLTENTIINRDDL